jgi:PAB-dependent poly(A)-specific ribonuclease subunit 3
MYDSTHPQSQSQQHAQSQPHTQDMHLLQQEDLTMFGRLLFALCTGTLATSGGGGGSSFQKSLEAMGRLYSPEVKSVALFLVNKGGPHKSIGQLLEIVSSRVVGEMGDALGAADTLENELMGELENARLVRLLCKFGFINERPECVPFLASFLPCASRF